MASHTLNNDEIEELLKDARKKQQIELTAPPPTLTELTIDDDFNAIQNQFDSACNDFLYIQGKIEENMELVAQTEFIMNMLNYTMYQIQYDFITKIDVLSKRKSEITHSVNPYEIEQELATINEEAEKMEIDHEQKFGKTKQQKIEVQDIYEKTINDLDNYYQTLKRHFNDIQTLTEAKKEMANTDASADLFLVQEFQELVNKYEQYQAQSWKTKEVRNILEKPTGLKLTKEGLLITETGKFVELEEVHAEQMLDFLDDYEFVSSKDDLLKDLSSQSESTVSGERIESQDVEYLKKHFGVPLTLALAEITAVQPRDPVHYLGHWLFKYRYNEEVSDTKKTEIEELEQERNRIAMEKWQRFVEEEARGAVIAMIYRAEEEAMKNNLIPEEQRTQVEFDQETEVILLEEAKDKFESY